jgi:hypothetical protein
MFLLLLTGACLGQLQATEMKGLYEVETPTDNNATWTMPLRTAMRVVLIRLTGDQNIADQPGGAKIIEDAEKYVEQITTKKGKPPANAPTAPPPLMLWVQFDKTALDQAIQAAGLRLWRGNRPNTLIWLVQGDAKPPTFITWGEQSSYAARLQEQAVQRALPILFPLMDLEDELKLKAADVVQERIGAIQAASERYSADAVLTGELSGPVTGPVQGRWTLYMKGEKAKNQQWILDANQVDELLKRGLDNATDVIAKWQPPSAASTQVARVELVVEGLTQLDQYARAQRYLKTLNFVSAVGVTQVEPERVYFSLAARGGMEAVAKALHTSHLLQPVEMEIGHYRYLGE